MERIIKLQIEGMHCQSCAEVITLELNEIPGIKSAKINSQTKEGTVVAAGKVGDARIIAAVSRAGYNGRITGQ